MPCPKKSSCTFAIAALRSWNFLRTPSAKRMLDRSYAEIFARRILPKDETVHIFNVSVARLMNRDLLSCNQHVPVQQAAILMSRRKCSSIFVQNDEGQQVGIVTDTDLRNRVIARGLEINIPVSAIMSSPLSMIPEQMSVFEAHAGDDAEKAQTPCRSKTAAAKWSAPSPAATCWPPRASRTLFIVREIAAALSREELKTQQDRIPGLVQNLISSGAKAENVTRLIATVSDAILQRLIEIALEQNGPPPEPFVFMIMGSEGPPGTDPQKPIRTMPSSFGTFPKTGCRMSKIIS